MRRTTTRTAFAIQELLAGRWASADGGPDDAVPGEPDVRLRCYLNVSQELLPQR
ncbi:DUF6207 family protein [Streptomyces olindensis]|uniref:DUF6207 family protein n=1 Tax=Streptomyces olindensis TaxID=358823 RepID=UPI0036AD75B6